MRRKENRITSRIALAIIASMVTMGIVAQAPAKRPTLVVGIMVDGLNSDYLELLKGYFGEGGFKRLMRDGVTLENVEYGPGVDRASATAMISPEQQPQSTVFRQQQFMTPKRKLATLYCSIHQK